jgi:aminoglycoside phosphotransferase (APT) family kinase protein
MVIAVHTAPAEARRHALADDFTVPYRGELEAACEPAGEGADCGPYARAAAALVRRNAAAITRLLARYDRLVAVARSQPPGRAVLTHGEPHPGNTILTSGASAARWLLIDWDTALVAPPERDLWLLDPGDGTILHAYAEATGVGPEPALLELYRLRWDITDLALDSARLRRPHADTADAEKTWQVLRTLVERIASRLAG